MVNGLQLKIPGVTFSDTTRPLILPSLGTSVSAAHRWAARSIGGKLAGEQITSWVDSVASKALTPNAKDATPDQIPPQLRVDASGEQYVRTQGKLTVTFTAATDLVTFSAAHGLVVDDQIQFSDVTTVAGVVAKTTYYVKTVPSSTTATLTATKGGATLDITTDGTGNFMHGLSLAAVDLVPANHQTVAFLFRRPAGGGFIWSGSGVILTQTGANLELTLTGNTGAKPTATPTTSIFTGWHIVVARFNGNASNMILDGIASTGTPIGVTLTAPNGYSLNSELSTAPTVPTDYVEAASFPGVLSDADCAALRASWKAAYSGLTIA